MILVMINKGRKILSNIRKNILRELSIDLLITIFFVLILSPVVIFFSACMSIILVIGVNPLPLIIKPVFESFYVSGIGITGFVICMLINLYLPDNRC